MDNSSDCTGSSDHPGSPDGTSFPTTGDPAPALLPEGIAPAVPGYAVGRELGRGSTAGVWLVTDELTKHPFALKCFVPGKGAHASAEEQGLAGTEAAVRREIRILSALEHQHLVKAHSVVRLGGAADGGLGLVMDYAAGG